MTEKRFKLHIIWYNKEKTEGEAELTDNGQPLLCTEYIYDARLLKNLLNELHEENEQLKSELRNLRRLANVLYMEGSEWVKNDMD